MDKLLYISTGIPKEEADELRKKQIDFSSNALLPISVFHGNILKGLSNSYDEVEALCGVPISRRHFNLCSYRGKKIQKGNIRYTIPGFLNIPVIKQMTTIAQLYWNSVKWCVKNRKHNCHIIIDGTFFTGLVALSAVRQFMNVKIGAILVDYYSFMEPDGRTLSQKWFYKMMKNVDRFVFVTDYLQQVVNCENKPFVIMEGLVSGQLENTAFGSIGNYCIYAGGLHEIYGVKTLVDAFHESSIPYEIHFYGNGEVVSYIEAVEKIDPRIKYMGIVSHDALLKLEQGAKLLVNPRPVRGKLDTRYNFPSKLMEYMQSGRPVITTKLLGIPGDYDDCMFFFEDDTKEGIRQGLERVLAMDEVELQAFGQHAQSYVNENKNNIIQGQSIRRLMDLEDTV